MKIIIQGEKEVLTAQCARQDANKVVRPFDLTGNVEITATLKLGSTILRKYRVASPVGVTISGDATDGKILIEVTATESATFAKGTGGILEVKVDKGSGDITKFQLAKAFQVDEAL